MATGHDLLSITKTLSGTTADTITIDQLWPYLQITNLDTTNTLWVRSDGTSAPPAAVAAAAGCIPITPLQTRVIQSLPIQTGTGAGTTVISVVGNGGSYTVTGVGTQVNSLSGLDARYQPINSSVPAVLLAAYSPHANAYSGSPTSDITALNAVAAAALALGGAKVVIGVGSYYIDSSWVVPSGIDVEFIPGAMLVVPAGCTFDAIVFETCVGNTITRPVVRKLSGAACAGNRAGIAIRGTSTDIEVIRGDVDSMGRGYDVAGVEQAVAAGTCGRITLRDCKSANAVQFGVSVGDTSVIMLDNFRSLSSGLDGIKILKNTPNWFVLGGYVTGATGGDGIDCYGGGRNFQIVGFTSESNGVGGVVIKSSAANATRAVTVTASTDVFTAVDHGLVSGTAVVFSSTSGASPVVGGTTYYVRDITADTFKIAATSGGAAIDITVDGTASMRWVGYDYVDQGIIDDLRVIGNAGYGLTIHRHSAESGDETTEPLPSYINVGTVIARGNLGYGVYCRAYGVNIASIIALGNGLHGVSIDEVCSDISVGQVLAAGNGTLASNTYNGVHVSAGARRIRFNYINALGAYVRGATSQADLDAAVAVQRYGLYVEALANVDAPVVDGDGNLSGLVNDLSNSIARDRIITGENVFPRNGASANIATGVSGDLNLVYFVAEKTETITKIKVRTGTTAAGATPTLVRYGVYEEAANGDLTLIASIVNDTTIFASASSIYQKTLSASWKKLRGHRYAIGILIVTGAAMPTLVGEVAGSGMQNEYALPPRLTALVGSQSDLPSPIAVASLVASSRRPWVGMLP